MGRTMFDEQRNRLLADLDLAHAAFYEAAVFGGPSLHFHLGSLDAAKEGDVERVAECFYAVLAFNALSVGSDGGHLKLLSRYDRA